MSAVLIISLAPLPSYVEDATAAEPLTTGTQPANAPARVTLNDNIGVAVVKLFASAEDREKGTPELGDTPVGTNQYIYARYEIDFKQGHPNENELSYAINLPSNMTSVGVDTQILNDEGEATIWDEGTRAGTWSISDGVLYFDYDADWVRAHPSDVEAHFELQFKMDAGSATPGTKESFDFPGEGGNVDVVVSTPKPTASKTKVAVEGEPHTYLVTVNLNTPTAASSTVLVDTMTPTLEFVPGSFTFDGASIADPQVTQAGEVTYGDAENYQERSLSKALTFTSNLGAITAGDHVYTYKVRLTEASEAELSANGSWAPGYAPGTSWGNTATWTLDGQDPVSGKTDFTSISFSLLDKPDQTVEEDGTITWTVTLNKGEASERHDLAGYTVRDQLALQHSYVGTYTVRCTTNSSIAPVEGEIAEGATEFEYTFPTDAGKETYTITYTTKVDSSYLDSDGLFAKPGRFENHATVEKDDVVFDNKESEAIGVGPDTYIEKSQTEAIDSEGKASWQIIVHAGLREANDPTGLVITDTLANVSNFAFADGQLPTITYGDGKALVVGEATFEETTDAEGNTTTAEEPTIPEGVDAYVVQDGRTITIKFCDTSATHEAVTGDIFINYSTQGSTANGTYSNTAKMEYDHITHSATAAETLADNIKPAKFGDIEKDAEGKWKATWRVRINDKYTSDPKNYNWFAPNKDLRGEDVTIVDTLPAGMTYDQTSTEIRLYQYSLENPNSYGDGRYIKSITADPIALPNPLGSGTLLTWVVPASEFEADANGQYLYALYLSFTSTIDDESTPGVGETNNYTNVVSALVGDEPLGSGEASVSASGDVLAKEGRAVPGAGSLLEYTVDVNMDARDLSAGDTITLVDTLDYQTTLQPATFSVTDADGNDITEECNLSGESIEDEAGNPTTRITVVLPDEQFVTVKYTVRVNGEVGTTVDVANEALLSGYEDNKAVADNEFAILSASGGTTGRAGSITVTKVDSTDLTRFIEGVVFDLYRVDLDAWVGNADASTASEKIASGTTNNLGKILFANDDSGKALETDVLYYLVETKAAEGYKRNAEKYFIMSEGENFAEQSEAARSHGITLHVGGDQLITNDREYLHAMFISKRDISGEELEGAQLIITGTDKDGNEIEPISWTSSGENPHYVQLPEGRFTLHEVAPPSNGYQVITDIVFTVDAEGNASVVSGADGSIGQHSVVNDDKGTIIGTVPIVIATDKYAPTTAVLRATKNLENATIIEDEFTFLLQDPSGNTLQSKVVPAGGATGEVVFDALSFTAPGTYSYIIVESNADTTEAKDGQFEGVEAGFYKGGVYFDLHAETVSVNVAWSEEAQSLVASVAYDEDGAVISNVYDEDYIVVDEKDNHPRNPNVEPDTPKDDGGDTPKGDEGDTPATDDKPKNNKPNTTTKTPTPSRPSAPAAAGTTRTADALETGTIAMLGLLALLASGVCVTALQRRKCRAYEGKHVNK